MHFGFALDLSDIDLWNIDFLDTHLDLLDTDITSKNFVCLRDVLKTSSRYVFKTSSRRLQNVLEDVKLLRWRRVEDVFKTCLQDVFKTCLQDVFKTCLQDIFKTCLQDVFKICLQDVFKTCLQDVFKTSWKT